MRDLPSHDSLLNDDSLGDGSRLQKITEYLQIKSKNNNLTLSDIALMHERASLLVSRSLLEQARDQYLQILHLDPSHLSTLINIAVLLVDMGYNSAAKTAYLQAIKHHPSDPLSRVNLGNLYFLERDFEQAKQLYMDVIALFKASTQSKGLSEDEALISQQHLAHAHQGLSLVYFESGLNDLANEHHRIGYSLESYRCFSPSSLDKKSSILVLIGGRGGDVAWRSLIDPNKFEVCTYAAEFNTNDESFVKRLSRHDLIFNAIGDADSSARALIEAKNLIHQLSRLGKKPVINEPDQVLKTGRLANFERFADLVGVRVPRSLVISRAQLVGKNNVLKKIENHLSFPVLIRSLGFQTGKHFELIDSADVLLDGLTKLPGDEFLVMEFLNAKDDRGFFRKYRVMFIGGQLYPVHLALSQFWKVHYFSAAMKDSPENRDVENHFLNNMKAHLGARAYQALISIASMMNLDYAGIDFGIHSSGDLLFFEANATMVMALPPDDPIWQYRRQHILNARSAAENLFIQNLSTGGSISV
jgi:tetratricopeptide (TPR) repeat protein